MKIWTITTMGFALALAPLATQLPVRARSQSMTPLATTTIPSAQLIQPEQLKTLLRVVPAQLGASKKHMRQNSELDVRSLQSCLAV